MHLRVMRTSVMVVFTAATAVVFAQSAGITGTWRTPTGSAIRTYSCGPETCFKIVEIEKSSPYTKDGLNPDPSLRDRPLCGLEIGTGFRLQGDGTKADKGHVYDPKSGKTYSGSLEMDGPDRLKLRGFIGAKLFGRTEEWTRATAPVEMCKVT